MTTPSETVTLLRSVAEQAAPRLRNSGDPWLVSLGHDLGALLAATSPEPKGDRVERVARARELATSAYDGQVFQAVQVSNHPAAAEVFLAMLDAALPPQAPAPDINEMVRKIEAKWGPFGVGRLEGAWKVWAMDSRQSGFLVEGQPDLLSALEAAAKRSEG